MMSKSSGAPFKDRVPTYDELNWPALEALRRLGGSATIAEHLTQVIEDQNIPESISVIPHGKSGRSELEYRLAWARTALRRCGYVENSARGVWSLTEAGEHATIGQLRQRINDLRSFDHKNYTSRSSQALENTPDYESDWKDSLLEVLRVQTQSAS